MIPWTIVLIALAVIYVAGCFLVELECFGWATIVLIASVVGVQCLHVFDIVSYVAAHVLTSALYTAGYVVIGVIWSFIKWFSFLMKYRDKFRGLKQKFLDINKFPLNSTSLVDRQVSYAIKCAFEKYLLTHSPANIKFKSVAYRADGADADNDQPYNQPVNNLERDKLWIAFLDESKTPNNQTIPTTLTDAFEVFLREQHSYGDYADLRDGKKPVATANKAKITAWMAFWPCSMLSTLLNDPIRRLFKYLFKLFQGLYQKMSDWVFSNDPELK